MYKAILINKINLKIKENYTLYLKNKINKNKILQNLIEKRYNKSNNKQIKKNYKS